jgi:hypothetical protein
VRKLILIVVALITVAACTPEQVAELRHHVVATKDDVKVARAVNAAEAKGGSSFLQLAAALHSDPFLVCTRAHESDTAGGYQAYNSSGPWYGAYQFLQSTWDTTAVHAGLPYLVGRNILATNGFFQDVLAMDLYHWQGKAPWGGRC